jgi:hypothetical protein
VVDEFAASGLKLKRKLRPTVGFSKGDFARLTALAQGPVLDLFGGQCALIGLRLAASDEKGEESDRPAYFHGFHGFHDFHPAPANLARLTKPDESPVEPAA